MGYSKTWVLTKERLYLSQIKLNSSDGSSLLYFLVVSPYLFLFEQLSQRAVGFRTAPQTFKS